MEEFLFRKKILFGPPCKHLHTIVCIYAQHTDAKISVVYGMHDDSIIHFSCCIQAEGPVMQIGEDFPGEPLTITYHRHMYGLGEHYNSTKTMK